MNTIKTKILTLFLCATVAFSAVGFSACGNSELEAKLAELETKLTQQQEQIAVLEQDNTGLQAEITTLKTESDNYENKIEQYKEVLASDAIEYGTTAANSLGAPESFLMAAFKSNRSKFLLDEDITLTYYYGSPYYDGVLSGYDIPSFDIYFRNFESDDMYLMKHVEENFVSEKYNVEVVGTYPKKEKIFSYGEDFTVPKEAFIGESGSISLLFYGENIAPSAGETQKTYQRFAGCYFNYIIKDGIIEIWR